MLSPSHDSTLGPDSSYPDRSSDEDVSEEAQPRLCSLSEGTEGEIDICKGEGYKKEGIF